MYFAFEIYWSLKCPWTFFLCRKNFYAFRRSIQPDHHNKCIFQAYEKYIKNLIHKKCKLMVNFFSKGSVLSIWKIFDLDCRMGGGDRRYYIALYIYLQTLKQNPCKRSFSCKEKSLHTVISQQSIYRDKIHETLSFKGNMFLSELDYLFTVVQS